MASGTIRATSQQLRATLGEPADMDIQNTGATIMLYLWRWACGCRAEGSADRALCAPCPSHAGSLARH